MKPLTVMAWDTATDWCAVVLESFEAGGPVSLGRFASNDSGTHSQVLPGAVEGLLKEAGLKPGDLDLLAVGRGPGSFTGLRTGLSLAKGLAMGAGLPLIGLSSLTVLAAGALAFNHQALVAPLIDARHQQVFTGLYEIDRAEPAGLPRELLAPLPLIPAELPEILIKASGGREVFLSGPALGLLEAAFPGGLPAPLSAALEPSPPNVSELARLAAHLWLGDKQAVDKYPPIPMYIRQPDIRQSGIAMR